MFSKGVNENFVAQTWSRCSHSMQSAVLNVHPCGNQVSAPTVFEVRTWLGVRADLEMT